MTKLKSNTIIKLLIIIIAILLLSNIYIFNKNNVSCDNQEIEFVYKETDGSYNSKEEYYKVINYKTFNKFYTGNKMKTIAIADSRTNNYKRFLELINKYSFYKNTKIYVLDLANLSKKDKIAFYNIDIVLKENENNFIITVNDNEILSTTTFSKEKINDFTKGLGD